MRVRAESVVVRYPQLTAPALDGVSLDVPAGSLYAVFGPNGSGKSTLMRGLLGVSALSSGRIFFDERPADAWSRRDIARAVGAVPQSESFAFPLTTREMVEMGRYPHLGPLAPPTDGDRTAVERALAACNVTDLAERDVTTLSGGELQRTRIARALAQEPRALVLDEPTANLDIRHVMEILELLRASADRGMTILLITHELESVARFADRMLLLSRGRVAAEGTAADVIREDVLRTVYDWPISVHEDSAARTLRIVPMRRVPHTL